MNNLFDIAEKHGIIVDYLSLPLNKSICIQGDSGDIVLMDYSLITRRREERVCLAHEIGHSVTGAFYNPYSPYDIRGKHENRANKWALKEIVSHEQLDNAIKEGHTELWDLAEYFDVTEDFMKKALCWYRNGNMAVEYY